MDVAPKLAELALRRLGCPSSIAKAHTEVQRKMRHYVKTAVGISEGYIKYDTTPKMTMENGIILMILGLIGGIGQGGGSSPIIWLAVLMIMLMAYKVTQPGADMYDPVTKEKVTFWLTSYVDDNTIVRYFSRSTSMIEILGAMTESLNEWLKLLQMTGGDLSLSKCKISILKWQKKGSRGNITMVSKQQEGGTVTMTSTTDGVEEKLERLEPWETERILGLRLPLTGSMTNELKFRKKKLDTFGTKMYKAPLTQVEAHIALQTRYYPMAKYPLPVTMFTTSELMEMQKKCIHKLLPKLGLNRNSPRAMIYGPRHLGGRQLMDLRVEQPTLHLEATMGHLRRGGKIGKALTITMRMTQAEVGTQTPFYELDPEKFNYTTPNTRWRYFWIATKEHGLMVKINNFWTPKKLYENDRNIMEMAVEDKKFQQKGQYKLASINKCQMYLQIFYLSEITDSNGRVKHEYLIGKQRKQNPQAIIPTPVTPTQTEWTEWKEFIFRNCLIRGHEVYPPLQEKVNSDINMKVTTEADIIKHIAQRGDTIRDIVDNLPIQMQQIMGEVDVPDDYGCEMAEMIKHGRIICASDGSMQQDDKTCRGGHAYTVCAWSSDRNRIKGMARTPDSTTMTSTTTEYYGAIAMTIMLLILETKYKIDVQRHSIELYCDNKEVVEKANNDDQILNISETIRPDYDLWQLLISLQRASTLNLQFKWVKGHQDTTKKGETLFGPFLRPAQLNIEMDAYASRGAKLMPNVTIVRPTYSTTSIGLYNLQHLQVTDIRKHITTYTNSCDLKEYLQAKNDWNDEDMKKISWGGMEKALTSYKPHKQTKMAQLMHDWQWVGERKKLIETGNLGICPACGKEEKRLHYLHCQHKELKESRYTLLRLLSSQLTAAGTFPGINTAFTNILQHGFADEWMSTIMTGHGLDRQLHDAIRSQRSLGTNSLAKGYISAEWEKVQNTWEKQSSQPGARHWAKEAITAIHSYTYGTWKLRNEYEHGKSEFSTRAQKRKQLQEKVAILYKKPRYKLKKKDHIHFKLPVAQRVCKSIEAMELWVTMVESIFKLRQRESAETLDTWLTATTPERDWKDKYKENGSVNKTDKNNLTI